MKPEMQGVELVECQRADRRRTRMFALPRVAQLVVLVVVAGAANACTIKATDGSSDDDKTASGDAPSEEVEALFGDLPKPTSGTLGGVWSSTTKVDGATGNFRLRFGADTIVGGSKCTFDKSPIVIVTGQSTAYSTEDFEKEDGEFVISKGLKYARTEAGLECSGLFTANTWAFKIDGTKLDLLSKGEVVGSFTKVGD